MRVWSMIVAVAFGFAACGGEEACTDGEHQCDGDVSQVCTDGAWEDDTDCTTDGGTCDAATGECAAAA
ncbi:MAG: hypothetical protein ABMB14_22165 [Myxococcota bacterium]